ncbi:hypothetical protein PTSG_07276 [Salpingoeca rosetta]|uniref:Phosphatidylserine synthase n=1 Tax=Salpingoeca rosetta (strain ATCC 50818 / BSB-021) TaxID=946362 RepID=F2UIY7_SALR5|nr:uncharacterized protein PTSG_07276 [Salpingoeca rosetta]EGD76935.1 hypothetical protein PTSG_07276 [Salpingoeca rosetta]|eukprot:XP_004990775.1 hypothetical protein PTSG_07276 [Salpingoeca rosetta]
MVAATADERKRQPRQPRQRAVSLNDATATAFVSQGPYRFKIHNTNFEDDGSQSWFWRPHVVTVLTLVVCAVVYMALFLDDEDSSINAQRGVAVACGVFLVQAAMQFNDGPFIRPHPVVWRLVLGASVLYEMGLLFILFQKPEDGRRALKFLDPNLGQKLPEQTYADDCRIYVPDHPSGNPYANFLQKMDRFVIAHALGWVVKALAFRNLKILLVCSFAFELFEYMLEFQLPNFGECWWDHWVLDFIVCNGGGIAVGLLLCRYLEMKEYRWRGINKIPTARGKLMRAIAQFSPYAWTNFQWGPYRDLKHWLVTLFAIWMMLCSDLNAFYLKSTLWIPADHSFNVYRLLFAGCAAPVAVAELNAYITDPTCKKMGQQVSMVGLILITEDLIAYKYWDDIPPLTAADPAWLMTAGVVAFVLVAITIHYAIKELFCPNKQRAHALDIALQPKKLQ